MNRRHGTFRPNTTRSYRAVARPHSGIWDRRQIRANLKQALLTIGGKKFVLSVKEVLSVGALPLLTVRLTRAKLVCFDTLRSAAFAFFGEDKHPHITQHFLNNTTVQALFPYTAALSAAKKAGAGLDGFCKK